MRHGWVVIAGLLLLGGCNNGLQPSRLEFAQAWVGIPATLPLTFTLNGKPLQEPVFTGPTDIAGDGQFTLLAGPLSQQQQLKLLARAPGVITATLSVKAQGQTFQIPITANVAVPTSCAEVEAGDAGNPCALLTFSTSQGQCVETNAPDGTACGSGQASCSTSFTCQGGVCAAGAAIGGSCAPDATPSTMLMPAWTYTPQPPLTLALSDIYDTSGNQYLVECGASTCDVASIDLNGAPRWRQAGVVSMGTGQSLMQGLVVSDALILSPDGTTLEAFSLVDGTALWSFDGSPGVIGAVAAGHGSQIAALLGAPRSPPFQVALLDIADGGSSTLPTLSLNSIALAFVGDGQSNVWGMIDESLHENPFPLAPFQVDLTTGNTVDGVSGGINQELQTGLGSGPIAVVGTTVLTSVGAWMGVTQVPGFPSTSSGTIYDAVMRADGSAFIRTQGNNSGCQGSALLSFDATLANQTSQCFLPEAGDAEGVNEAFSTLTLTSTGGIVYATWTRSPARLEVLGSDGTLAQDAVLGGLSNAIAWHAALIGSRWIATMIPDPNANVTPTPSNFIAAYDLTGVMGATSGWVGRAGGPARDGTPH